MRMLAAVCLAGALGLAACERAAEPDDGPRPALSRAGSRWQVTHGDRQVMLLINEAGTLHWTSTEVAHPFASGTIQDKREEPRMKDFARKARHFRDLVNRLEQAGYGVAEVPSPTTAIQGTGKSP